MRASEARARERENNYMKTKNILKSDSVYGWKAGTCMTCVNDYLFCEHRMEEKAAEERLSKTVMHCVESAQLRNLQRIASRHELESDEFSTAYEKALALV